MAENIAIIDGDGLAFHSLRETLGESLQALDERMDNIITKTQATAYMLFISKGKYFRHEIFPDYKKPRDKYKKDRVTYTRTLKAVLQDKYGAVFMPRVEADDLCAYFYIRLWSVPDNPINAILCTPDKDLLKGIPSFNKQGHFNYSFKVEDKTVENSPIVRGWWIDTSIDEASEVFWTSMIAGDSSDGVPGIFKKGPKAAKKLFDSIDSPIINDTIYSNAVLDYFIEHYGVSKGIFEFQKHYRVLRLLQNDEEFKQEVGITPDEAGVGVVCELETSPFEDDSSNQW